MVTVDQHRVAVIDGPGVHRCASDGTLARHQARIDAALRGLCAAFQAETLLAPFRLDWHPDHPIVPRAAVAVTCAPTSVASTR